MKRYSPKIVNSPMGLMVEMLESDNGDFVRLEDCRLSFDEKRYYFHYHGMEIPIKYDCYGEYPHWTDFDFAEDYVTVGDGDQIPLLAFTTGYKETLRKQAFKAFINQ